MRGHRGSFLGAVLLLVLLAGLAGDLGHSSRGIGKHGRSASGVHTLPRRSREAVALDATSGAVKTLPPSSSSRRWLLPSIVAAAAVAFLVSRRRGGAAIERSDLDDATRWLTAK